MINLIYPDTLTIIIQTGLLAVGKQYTSHYEFTLQLLLIIECKKGHNHCTAQFLVKWRQGFTRKRYILGIEVN